MEYHIILWLAYFNLHNTTKLQEIMYPRNQWSPMCTVLLIVDMQQVYPILACPLGCFLCRPDGINKLTRNHCAVTALSQQI